MSNNDYALFIEAVKTNDEPLLNKMFNILRDKIIYHLTYNWRANISDAEDCSQESFTKTLQAIREDRIRDHNKILPYLNRAAENEFIKLCKKNNRLYSVSPQDTHFDETKPDHLYQLIEDEFFKHFILCLNTLDYKHRKCIVYWLKNPDADSRELAKDCDISLSNTYTRKHRAIKTIREEIENYITIHRLDARTKKRLYKRLPAKFNESYDPTVKKITY